MTQNRPGHIFSTLYFPKYCEQELCTYRTLKCYLERTLPVRAVEHTALLLSYVKPFAPVGSSTVARWIKNLLEQSGEDTSVFKAHGNRAASSSKANQTVPIDAILKHIGWSTESTFRKFLQKAIVDIDSFQNAVLRWLNTVSCTYIWMGRYNHSLSLDATVMVSKNCPVIGEHLVIIFFWHYRLP